MTLWLAQREAPTGRFWATTGTFVTTWTKHNGSSQETPFIDFIDSTMGLSPFCGCSTTKGT